MRCRLCELFMDQLQALNLSSFHGSSSTQPHHQHHYHTPAVAGSALLLPQMRDIITACLTRGRDAYFLFWQCLIACLNCTNSPQGFFLSALWGMSWLIFVVLSFVLGTILVARNVLLCPVRMYVCMMMMMMMMMMLIIIIQIQLIFFICICQHNT
jgi:hypothetical protein